MNKNHAIVAVFTLIFAAGVIGCEQGFRKHTALHGMAIGKSTDSHRWIVQYGCDSSERLRVAAFTGVANDKKEVSFDGMIITGTSPWKLIRPDGKEIILPSDIQLYESVDGDFKQSRESVTKAELLAFLESNPRRYDIDELVAFAKKSRSK